MLCEKASYLINQLRTESDLSIYDEETVREIISEIGTLFDSMKDNVQNNKEKLGTPSFATNLLVYKTSMFRNKQCVIKYL